MKNKVNFFSNIPTGRKNPNEKFLSKMADEKGRPRRGSTASNPGRKGSVNQKDKIDKSKKDPNEDDTLFPCGSCKEPVLDDHKALKCEVCQCFPTLKNIKFFHSQTKN